jgi:hypothetical protein
MAPGPFPFTIFQLANALPVSNGHVVINLSKDATATTGPIGAKVKVTISLDVNGEITGVPEPLFWPNAELNPTDTYYIYTVYNSNGQPLTGPLYTTVAQSGVGFGLAFGSNFAS